MSGRRQSFSTRWHELLDGSGHQAIRVYASRPNFFRSVQDCDGFMWWFAHLPFPRNFGKRLVQAVEHGIGIPVFPGYRTIWHFDDKIAQQYLLEAAGIPVPTTHVFWLEKDADDFWAQARFPLVIKLTSGITSENVAMLRTRQDAQYWTKRLFRRGAVTLKRGALMVRPRTMARRLADAGQLVFSGAMPQIGERTD